MKRIIGTLLAVCTALTLCFGCGGQKEQESKSLPYLENATYAVLVGTTSEQYVDEHYPDATKLAFDSINDAVLALSSGKADYVVSAYTNCLGFMRANPGKFTMLPEKLTDEGASIAVGKENEELLEDINRVLEQFRADGTLDRILSNWLREDDSDYVRETIPVVEDGPVLSVATSAEREPMCFIEHGKITGIDAELISRIAYELGMRVELVDMKFSAMIPSVLSGKTAVAISNITATEERAQSVSFSSVYYINPQMLMTRSEYARAVEQSKKYYTTLDELAGKRIGIVLGSVFDEFALKQWPDAQISIYDGNPDLIVALQQGKIDAFIADQPVVRDIINGNSGLMMIDELLAPDSYGFAFSKDEKGGKLRDEFNEFMRTAADGKLLEKLDAIWFGSDETLKNIDAASSLPALNGTVRFASPMMMSPFDYLRDGVPVGLEVDLITRFCKEKGYGLVISTVSFGSLLPGLVSGKYDAAASSISITEERAKSIHFSDAYYSGGVAAMVLCDEKEELPIDSYEGVAAWFPQKRLGMYMGATLTEPLTSMVKDCELSWLNTYADMAMAVNAGQIDGFFCEEPLAPFVCAETKGLYNTGILLNEENYSCVFSKSNSELCTKLNATIERLTRDGTIEKMQKKWGSTDSSRHVMPQIELTGENGTLRVATSNDTAPFGFLREGEYVGYDFELLAYFAQEHGYKLSYEHIDWAATTAAVVSGKYDIGVGCMIATDEREDTVLFSEPIYYSGVVLITADKYAPGNGDEDEPDEKSFFASIADSFRRNFIVENRWKLIVSGIGVTLLLSVCSGIVGMIVGFGFCLLRMSRARVLGASVEGVTRVLQGTPMVVLLMILYYIVFNKTGLDGISVSIIAFGLNFGAYASEIMLSGIRAVDGGQREAAAALGFTPAQTFRKIIFPQAARHFLPVLKGEYISLVKMTSIAGYVAAQDLTKASDLIRSRTYEAFFPLIVTAIIYFLLSYGLASLLQLIEVRIDPKRRARSLKGVKLQ